MNIIKKTAENQLLSPQNTAESNFLHFLKHCFRCRTLDEKDLVEKAFYFAQKTFRNEHFLHADKILSDATDVATILTNQIGLGAKSVAAVFLKDLLTQTSLTTDDLKQHFGEKITFIAQNVSAINEKINLGSGQQYEILREIILNLSDDIRVIFVKLSESLHRMRQLNQENRIEQIKFVDEVKNIYAPLAHRLGLYSIKTEMEDLWLKFTHPQMYAELAQKMKGTEEQRTLFINRFSLPLINELAKNNIEFDITGRPKSIFSVWNKMQNKKVGFDEVYDLFAVRIIYTPKNQATETEEAMKIYSIIKDLYDIHPARIRDWISKPKNNGYEALHITVMSKSGQWVEIQIRSKRMDEVAEFGLASHWKYKGVKDKKTELDNWVKEIKKKLESNKEEDIRFLDEFKLGAFSDEIRVFTPKGEIISLPANANILDFAFEIHSDLAFACIGAKVNQRLVPVEYRLRSGDQVEVLTSKNKQPEYNWLTLVNTPKAKAGLKEFFKDKRKKLIENGRQTLEQILNDKGIVNHPPVIRKIMKNLQIKTKKTLYLQISTRKIQEKQLDDAIQKRSNSKIIKYWQLQLNSSFNKNGKINTPETNKINPDTIHSDIESHDFVSASCCNPLPGDKLLAYVSPKQKVVIHKENCKIALKILDKHPGSMFTAGWKSSKMLSFLAILNLWGIDNVGLISEITAVISKDYNVNIRNICFDTSNGNFEGKIELYVHNVSDLENIKDQLENIKGIKKVTRQ